MNGRTLDFLKVVVKQNKRIAGKWRCGHGRYFIVGIYAPEACVLYAVPEEAWDDFDCLELNDRPQFPYVDESEKSQALMSLPGEAEKEQMAVAQARGKMLVSVMLCLGDDVARQVAGVCRFDREEALMCAEHAPHLVAMLEKERVSVPFDSEAFEHTEKCRSEGVPCKLKGCEFYDDSQEQCCGGALGDETPLVSVCEKYVALRK